MLSKTKNAVTETEYIFHKFGLFATSKRSNNHFAMADTEPAPAADPAPAAGPTAVDDHPTALIGRGESVLVKQAPTDAENPKDVAAEIEAIKESEVRHTVLFLCLCIRFVHTIITYSFYMKAAEVKLMFMLRVILYHF